jgi:hypothetical protein
MCVHLCILASSRILRHVPGDKPILSDGSVTLALPSSSNAIELKSNAMLATKSDIFVPATINASFHASVCRQVLLSIDDITTPLPHAITILFQKFRDIFLAEIPLGLPPLKGIEHQTDLILGATLPNHATYRTNLEETKEIKRQVIQELLDHKCVRESLRPFIVPVILVPKENDTWHMCVDCGAINNITICYHFSIHRLHDMLDKLSGSIIFTNTDLQSGCHQIGMKLGDEWKITFKTRFGLYEWLVMPFGLTNAPSTFMRLMNEVLDSFIGKFVVVYFDDILIYSKSLDELIEHLCVAFVLYVRHVYLIALRSAPFAVTEMLFLVML